MNILDHISNIPSEISLLPNNRNLSLDIDKLNIPNVSMKYLSMGMSNDYKKI